MVQIAPGTVALHFLHPGRSRYFASGTVVLLCNHKILFVFFAVENDSAT